jgi:hypothetical protein
MDSPLIQAFPFMGSTQTMHYELFDKQVVNYQSLLSVASFFVTKAFGDLHM